jgi:hypothetical protein
MISIKTVQQLLIHKPHLPDSYSDGDKAYYYISPLKPKDSSGGIFLVRVSIDQEPGINRTLH